jgi:hypothetical protein
MKGITAIALLVLSLVDDAILLGVSQIGLHIAWLHRFIPVIWLVMIVTIALHFMPKKIFSQWFWRFLRGS